MYAYLDREDVPMATHDGLACRISTTYFTRNAIILIWLNI